MQLKLHSLKSETTLRRLRFDIPAISIITALRLYEFDLTCFVFLSAKSIYATFTSVECSLGNLVPSERWTVLSGVGRWLFIEVCLLWNFRLARWFHYLFCEEGMTVQSAGAHDEFYGANLLHLPHIWNVYKRWKTELWHNVLFYQLHSC